MNPSRPGQQAQSANLVFEKGLPAAVDSERLILGAAFDHELVAKVCELDSEIFSLEKHRRIHARIREIHERGDIVDRISLANALKDAGQLESVDGLTYLASLDPLASEPVFDTHVRTVREKFGLRQIIFTSQKAIDAALLGEYTPAEVLERTLPKLMDADQSARTDDGGKTTVDVIENFPGGLTAFLDPSRQVRGLPTGFHRYDEMTGGLQKGEVTVLAAATSMGKTAIMLNIIGHLALHPHLQKSAAIFSLEMSASSLVRRLMCAVARVDNHRFRNGWLEKNERERLAVALECLTNSHLKFYDQGDLSPEGIAQRIRKLVREEGLDIAAIDYLQLMGSHTKSENRNQEVSLISRKMVLLAKELGIPLVLLSQLSRAYSKRTDPRPQLSDLRDSGCLSRSTTRLLTPIGVQCGSISRMNTYSLSSRGVMVERVSKDIPNGNKRVVRVHLRSGRFLDCTPDHPILTDVGFVPAKDLTKEHAVAAVRSIPEPDSTRFIKEAKWIGWMLGNGSMVGYASPSFICSCVDVAAQFREETEKLFSVSPKPHAHKCRKVFQYDITASSVRTPEGNPVRNWLKEHDLWGRRSNEKRIPDWFMAQANNKALAALVAGLWETDGTVTRGTLKFSTTSNEMAWQVVWILARLGIFCYLDDGYTNETANHPCFTVKIADGRDIRRFQDIIPMIGRKGVSLRNIAISETAGSNHGDRLGLWVNDEIKDAVKRESLSWSKLGYRVQGKHISKEDLGKVISRTSTLNHLKPLTSPAIYWDRLKSISDLGVQEVFDREVIRGPHNFVANGIIVHNSIEQDAAVVAFLYREEVYKKDREDLKGLAELIISKQRNGPTGTVPLRFLGGFGKFENRAEDAPEENE